MLWSIIAVAIAVDFVYFSWECFSMALSSLTCTGMGRIVSAGDGFSVTMSFAVTYLAMLAAWHFIVELLRWAASMRIQAAEVAGDIEGEVKTEAVVPIPVVQVAFLSMHGLMWLNAVFRDLLSFIWMLFRGLFLAAVVSPCCARHLGLLYAGARLVEVRKLLIVNMEGTSGS